ncbi:hypothetical protein EX30DRAFT_362602 [Ascodesmis nigricans]|uniref:COP9 signalosome complex subunit 6 n=1 Tax=Ascodesmis nigricans TaxID=341454 RepID=A0A4S2N259_9PEZI|nr:hypothetical protein EX30DRAFT_362602 [Ascodesmis nigricans]
MASSSTPSLISSHPSTSGLQIALHPLALLTISDYITRHTLRCNNGPIVGVLLGSQNGRQIAVEHAYEVVALEDADQAVMIEKEWFDAKFKLFKETHPTQDLIGWFTTTRSPTFEPSPSNAALHQQLLSYNESLIMLLLNPTPSASIGGTLPLGIYESIYEADESDANHALRLSFVPLKYTIETGEAEMIAMDAVAKASGNAVDVPLSASGRSGGETSSTTDKDKGKEKEIVKEEKKDEGLRGPVGPQNDELLSNLAARRNAVTMLTSRIRLLLKYLQSPPPGLPNHHILREIKSLTHSRLPLLTPADLKAFETEKMAEEADVNLVVLLGALTKSIEEVGNVSKKFQGIEHAKKHKGFSRYQGDEGLGEMSGRGGGGRRPGWTTFSGY